MKNELQRVFRAFSDENRLRVLELLCEGEQCACILLADMNISQPTLSHHMKILCKSGIVNSRRVGKWNYYSINEEGCKYGIQLLNMIIDHKLDKTVRIARVLNGVFHPIRKWRKAHSVSEKSDCPDCTCGS